MWGFGRPIPGSDVHTRSCIEEHMARMQMPHYQLLRITAEKIWTSFRAEFESNEDTKFGSTV